MDEPVLDSSIEKWINYANTVTDAYSLTDDQKEIIKLTNNRRIAIFQFYIQNKWRLDKEFRLSLNSDYRNGVLRYRELVESSLVNYLIESGLEPKESYYTRNFIDQVNKGHVVSDSSDEEVT
jgi:hypothetical protein